MIFYKSSCMSCYDHTPKWTDDDRMMVSYPWALASFWVILIFPFPVISTSKFHENPCSLMHDSSLVPVYNLTHSTRVNEQEHQEHTSSLQRFARWFEMTLEELPLVRPDGNVQVTPQQLDSFRTAVTGQPQGPQDVSDSMKRFGRLFR